MSRVLPMQMDDHTAPSRWTKEAVEALWREHRGWVAALLYAHRHGSASAGAVDVHDLLQEVALSLVANIHKLNSPEKIGPWLRTVAMNVARDAGRRRQVRRNTHNAGEHLDGLPAQQARETAGEVEDAKSRGRRALAVVQSLPPEYREPLMLNLRGLSHKQVALVCELPVSTIETRIFRGRAMVRREMEAMEKMETGVEVGGRKEPGRPREAASGVVARGLKVSNKP